MSILLSGVIIVMVCISQSNHQDPFFFLNDGFALDSRGLFSYLFEGKFSNIIDVVTFYFFASLNCDISWLILCTSMHLLIYISRILVVSQFCVSSSLQTFFKVLLAFHVKFVCCIVKLSLWCIIDCILITFSCFFNVSQCGSHCMFLCLFLTILGFICFVFDVIYNHLQFC